LTGPTITVERQTDLIGPGTTMLGPVPSGALVTALNAPGCWGPMVTPSLRAGHEVTLPLAIEGAQPGDALAIFLKDVTVLSRACMSGVDRWVQGSYRTDPCVDARCPGCGRDNPETVIRGIGPECIRCRHCSTPVSPFTVSRGFTMVFDDDTSMGLTVGPAHARRIARRPRPLAHIPPSSRQHPALALAAADVSGTVARCRPFVGNIGTVPGRDMPCNRNAGDSARMLLQPSHPYHLEPDEMDCLTDGHMDNPRVRAGCLLVVPVKVPGGGLYLGDVHAMQGDGELAGHTTDVAADVLLQVILLKRLELEGPLLFPPVEDLPPLARPLSSHELSRARELAARSDIDLWEEVPLPLCAVGSGADINEAVHCALRRIAKLTGLELDEVRIRATIAGGADICRLPGVAQVCLLMPRVSLPTGGLRELVERQYGARGGVV